MDRVLQGLYLILSYVMDGGREQIIMNMGKNPTLRCDTEKTLHLDEDFMGNVRTFNNGWAPGLTPIMLKLENLYALVTDGVYVNRQGGELLTWWPARSRNRKILA